VDTAGGVGGAPHGRPESCKRQCNLNYFNYSSWGVLVETVVFRGVGDFWGGRLAMVTIHGLDLLLLPATVGGSGHTDFLSG